MPHRERYLLVCINRRDAGNPKGSCAAAGSESLVPALKEGLGQRGLAKRFRACTTSCLDLCEVGAAMIVEPDHVAYGKVTLADVPDILDSVEKGTIVERLVVHRPPRKDDP